MTTNMQFACSDHVSGGKLPMECRRHQWVWKGNKETVKADEGEAAIDCTEGHVNQCEPTETCSAVRFFLYTCTLECTVRACTTTPLLFGNCTWMHLGCPLEVFVFFYWPHHWWWCTYVHKLECLLTSVIRLVPSQPCKLILFCLFMPKRKSFEEASAS